MTIFIVIVLLLGFYQFISWINTAPLKKEVDSKNKKTTESKLNEDKKNKKEYDFYEEEEKFQQLDTCSQCKGMRIIKYCNNCHTQADVSYYTHDDDLEYYFYCKKCKANNRKENDLYTEDCDHCEGTGKYYSYDYYE